MSGTEIECQNTKPLLLKSLLQYYIPDLKRPFGNPLDLVYVLDSLQTHHLLSESTKPNTPQDVIDASTSAVDSWLKRVLALASCNMPDKCWAGICLLGVTCQECSSERFLASYSDWFNKLINYIQSPTDTLILKAACVSLSDLIKRLARYPNEKKDGNSQATKLIQPVLKLLNEDSSEVVWEEAICLLSTIITAFPSSVQRHYDAVEAAVVLKLMSEKSSESLSKKLFFVLSLLPKSRGDSESWTIMMQKILISIDNHLKDAFESLEEGSKRDEVKNLLLPPGKEPPPPLGGKVVQGVHLMQRPALLLISRISTLIGCCCQLLTNSYPVQVSVPVRALIALVDRVLVVDGSSSHGFFPSVSTMELTICSQLPLLHLYSLELLSSMIQGLGSLLLPHVADIIRFLTVYFKGCELPELRIKVYSIYKELLQSMGVGIVVYLAEVITGNEDLGSFDSKDGMPSSNVNTVSAEALLRPHQKKRKHAVTTAPASQQSDRDVLDVGLSLNLTTVSLKIAALEALEALLIVGGSFRSKDWRSNIDPLLAKVAINACKDGFLKEDQSSFHLVESTSTWACFQLAALRAFLASLVSPGFGRPRYLAQGLELFCRGSREGGARIAEFCAHSLMTLEVLYHPKSLPLVDSHNYDANREFADKMFPSGLAQNPLYHSSKLEKVQNEPFSDFVDPLQSFLQTDDEMENTQADVRNINGSEEACKVSFSGNHAEISKLPFSKYNDSGSAGQDDTKLERSDAGGSAAASAKMIVTEPSGVDYTSKGPTTALVSEGNIQNDDSLCLRNDMEIENNVNDHASNGMAEKSLVDKSKEFGFEMDNQSDVQTKLLK
ncbi:hypothetical protein Leryth_020239, partial [Lithospermum erythrorhizon]